eukprot:7288507-Alexandrium_andersonii.AAC.1
MESASHGMAELKRTLGGRRGGRSVDAPVDARGLVLEEASGLDELPGVAEEGRRHRGELADRRAFKGARE